MRRLRPPRLPRDLAALLPDRERPLAACPVTEGGWAVATKPGLAVLDRTALLWRRPWHEVDHGSWDEEAGAIRIRWVDGSRDAVPLDRNSARPLLEAFRDRVRASVIHSERLELEGGVTVRAVVRRAPDGHPFSQLLGDGPVPLSAEREVAALESRARRAAGLSG